MSPIYNDISVPDYNKRSLVSGAGYIKENNALGISFQITGPIAGAYLGYQSDLIEKQDGDSKKPILLANAALGAVVGYSVPFLMNLLGEKDQKFDVFDNKKWLEEKFPDYLMLEQYSTSNFVIIPSYIESEFQIKDIQDLRDFVSLFPNSKYFDKISKKAVTNLPRRNIPELVKIINNPTYIKNAKIKYYNLSNSVDQLKEAIRIYPEVRTEVDDCEIIKKLSLTNFKEILIYLANEFSKSDCIKIVHHKLIKQLGSVGECIDLMEKLPILKLDISEMVLSVSLDLKDLKEVYSYFPSKRNLVGQKAIALASNIEDLGFVYNNFAEVSKTAEYMALNRIKELEAKKLFVIYFRKSKFCNQVKEDIRIEETKRENLISLANEEGFKLMNEISDQGTGKRLNIEIGEYRSNGNIIYLPLKVTWVAGFMRLKTHDVGLTLKIDMKDEKVERLISYENKAVKSSKWWAKNRDAVVEVVSELSKKVIKSIRETMAKSSYYEKIGHDDYSLNDFNEKSSYSTKDFSHEIKKSLVVRKVNYISRKKDLFGVWVETYVVEFTNGKRVSIKKEGAKWYFKNNWGEKNRGIKAYDTQKEIINAISFD
jgi:hypothetical protein